LRFERLEDRSLLASAAFTMNLREDVGGSPGDMLSADEVREGESFFVEILAEEFDPLIQGLHGVALNVAWDPQVLAEIDAAFDPAQLITDDLPLFNTGTLNAAAGTIDNLSGSAFHAWNIGQPIGDAGPQRFALLRFRAVGDAGATSIHLSEGVSRIAAMPGGTLLTEQLSFEEQTVVVSSAAPAQALPPPEAEPEVTPPPISEPTDTPPTEVTTEVTVPVAPPPVEPVTEPDAEIIFATNDAPGSPPPANELHWNCDGTPIWPQPPAEVAAEPAAGDLPRPENPVAGPVPQPADLCPEDFDYAAAVDAVLMGPLTPDQSPPPALWLDQVLAVIAADIELRRLRALGQSTHVVCS
jgi:hypothetical protein